MNAVPPPSETETAEGGLAFAFLMVVVSLVLVALVWTVLKQPFGELLAVSAARSTTSQAQEGRKWVSLGFMWYPFFVLGFVAVYFLIRSVIEAGVR
ncbi:MAG: hypothetical protein SV253_08165 [Halobacteria archaeon]|nr:hypothetical protein [Halobacteria archaeon]